ncbi:MAG TPA: histidinol-phosphate transaminase [Polyangiales bacterium]|nr:histidinol-phosphate transaminase [Polyangiales bacterium]
MGYERESIHRMHGYVPGKQPASTDTIKLNTNENPYPPAPEVMRALLEVPAESLRRYPEPFADAFRILAAELHGVTRDHVMAVNGGDELLRLAVTTFVEPGSPVGVLEPSYSLYPVLAEIHGCPLTRVAAGEDFCVPDDFAARMNETGVSLAMLVNPHAPSGHLMKAEQVIAIARELKGVLLVDEAYVDFVDPELKHDLVPLLAEHDNVLLLRTLSKGYSLAGLRFGYALGTPSLIAPMLEKTRDSYNVDVVSQRMAAAALTARAYARETWEGVRLERTRVQAALRAMGLRVRDSQSNFLLAYVPIGAKAEAVQAELEAGGVLVRHFKQPRLEDALRITIGTQSQNDRLLTGLRAVLNVA